MTDALAFLERAEADETFAAGFGPVRHDPPAVVAKIREAGYDVTADDIRSAVIERYGLELTPEELDAIAAGDSSSLTGVTSLGPHGNTSFAAFAAF